MSNIVTIQGIQYTINSIEVAKTALIAAQNAQEVLSVLKIANNPIYVQIGAFEFSILTAKIDSLSTVAEGAELILNYSGNLKAGLGEMGSGLLAQAMSNASVVTVEGNSIRAVGVVDYTEAGLVIFNPAFELALEKSIAAPLSDAPAGVNAEQFIYGRDANGVRISYNDGMGLADLVSKRFMSDNDHLPTRAIVPTALESGAFAFAEVRAWLDGSSPSFEGVTRAEANQMYSTEKARAINSGYSPLEADKIAETKITDVIRLRSFENAIDLEYLTNNQGQIIGIASNGSGWAGVPGVSSTPFAVDDPNRHTLSQAMDKVLDTPHYNSYQSAADVLARNAGYEGFGYDGIGKAGAKVLNALGIIGDVAAVLFAMGAASEAWAAGDKQKAANILGEELAAIVGGVAIGGAAAIGVAMLLLPFTGVGVTAAVLIAGMAGGMGGDSAGRYLWNLVTDKLSDLTDMPGGSLDDILSNYLNLSGNVSSPAMLQVASLIYDVFNFIRHVPRPDPLVIDLNGNGQICCYLMCIKTFVSRYLDHLAMLIF
jgi:hypothetical protein